MLDQGSLCLSQALHHLAYAYAAWHLALLAVYTLYEAMEV